MPLSRRHLFGTAAAAGGVLALGRGGTAWAAGFGSASWHTVVPGVGVNGLAFRLGTGEDDLRGPEGLSPASAIDATVVLESSAGRSVITGQLNSPDEGWRKWTVHDKWLSFSRSGLRPVLAENIRSISLHFTPGQGGLFGDNWDMVDITVFHPHGDGLGDPAFTGTVPTDRFAPVFSGSGRPWHHRFRENPDSEGGPDYTSANPHWNPVVAQAGWRWCNRCQGLFFGGNGTSGACPAGGGHNSTGSGNYFMTAYTTRLPGNVEQNWRWCNRCQGMFTGSRPSRCPLGGGHDSWGSGNYSMFVSNGVVIGKQAGWRSCAKCAGLYFAGNPTAGACPAGGGHDGTYSPRYMMAFTATP